MNKIAVSVLTGFLTSTALHAESPKRPFSKNIHESDLQPTNEAPCVYPDRYESILTTVPLSGRVLIPQLAKDRGWELVMTPAEQSGKPTNIPFCVHPKEYPLTPLFRDAETNEYYIYDFIKNVPVLAWSEISQPQDSGMIWVDHLSQIVWSSPVKEVIESNSFSEVVRKKLLNIDEALEAKKTYATQDFGAGSWKLPKLDDFQESWLMGSRVVLSGMIPYDIKVSHNYSPGYGNPYWVFTGALNDENQESVERLEAFSGKYGSVYNRGYGIVAEALDSLNRNGDRNYARFILKSDQVQKALQIQNR